MNLDRWGMARENAYQKLEQEAQIQIYRRRLLDSGVIVEEEFINGKAVDMDDAKRAYEVLAEIHAAEARLDAPDAAKRREFRLRLRPSLSGAAALLNDPSKYKGPRRHEDLLFAFQHSPPPPPELRAMMTSGAGGFGTRAIAGTAGDASDPSTSYGAGGTGGGGGWGSGYYAGGSADRWTPSLSRRGRGAPVQSNEQRVKGLTHRIALRAFLYGTAGASVLGSFVFAWGLSQAKPDWSAIGRAAGGLQDASKKSREGVGGRG